jgi:hypothetical protein
MHRFDGFQDQLAALLHQPKTEACLGDSPNWEIPLSLVWLHPDPFASTAALTGYEHWLARGDRI